MYDCHSGMQWLLVGHRLHDCHSVVFSVARVALLRSGELKEVGNRLVDGVGSCRPGLDVSITRWGTASEHLGEHDISCTQAMVIYNNTVNAHAI